MKLAAMPVCALAAGAALCAFAQEMGEIVEQPAETPAQLAQDAVQTVQESARADQGVQVVEEAQKTPPAEYAGAKNANDAMVEWIGARGYIEGYSTERGYFLQIGVARDNSMNPVEEDFMTKRELLYREAQLRAKIEISALVEREANGANWKQGLDEKQVKEFEARFASEINAMNEMKRKVAKLMVALDTAETEALKGVTTTDRLNRLVDAAIKKLDSSYAAGEIAAEKQARYEEIRRAYETAKAAADELELKKSDLFPDQTVGAKIDTAATLRLHGVVPLHTIESYDGKEYQIAVAAIWSPKLEERAMKILARKEVAAGKPMEDRTLQEYLRANREALAAMVGSRQFFDKNGRLYFYGVSAQDLPEDAIEKDEAMTFANAMAIQSVLMSLYTEGTGVTKASAALAKRKKRAGEVVKTLSENMYESTPQNMIVSGLGKVYSFETESPVTHKPIYISVAAVDAALAAKAPAIKRAWDVNASNTVRTLNAIAGERQGAEDAYQDAKNSKVEFENARRNARDAINAEVKRARGGAVQAAPVAPRAPQKPGKASQGIFGADAAVSDDF